MSEHECTSVDGGDDCTCDPEECDECYGIGNVDCWECGGDGMTSILGEDEDDEEYTCSECDGAGVTTCGLCDGSGEEMRKAPDLSGAIKSE